MATKRALECIFLPSVHTLAFGTPQPICPPSPAISFSILNYSNNVEVFIRCSSPPPQRLCASHPATLLWFGDRNPAWHEWENLHSDRWIRERTHGKWINKQTNEAEIERWIGEECREVTSFLGFLFSAPPSWLSLVHRSLAQYQGTCFFLVCFFFFKLQVVM